jgi:hypothetical protein
VLACTPLDCVPAGFGFYYIVPGAFSAAALARMRPGTQLRTLLDPQEKVCHGPIKAFEGETDGDVQV